MIESEIINLIGNMGFPIAMCFYLMFRFEKTLQKNTESVQELTKYLKDKKN
ncbi:YvrJ family protein [Candidatus Woesearchaeota archaeon]|nr:YvrJ family protein [Candidatus Woesearchaeota archaeon]